MELLIENKYLSNKLGKKLVSMVGLRNLLTHEYIAIDIERLFKLLNNLDDFVSFAAEMKQWLE